MLFNSLFKLVMRFSRFSRFSPPKWKQASSAYNTVNSSSETLKISLIKMIKRRGPKIDPCGTPQLRKKCIRFDTIISNILRSICEVDFTPFKNITSDAICIHLSNKYGVIYSIKSFFQIQKHSDHQINGINA